MKRFKAMALVCALVLCAGFALSGCQPQTYVPPAKEQTVSDSALGTAGTLRVGVNASEGPLAGPATSSSRIVGVDVDAAAYIADQLGLKLEVVDVGSDPSSAIADGKVDVVLGVDDSEEGEGYWKSDPYLQTGIALFGTAAETSVPTADSEPKIAAQASTKSSWRVTNLFGDSSLVVQDDLKSAFAAMDKGDARYVASSAVIGTFVAYTNGYDDKIVALLQEPSGYCVAVAEANTDLQNAIAGAVQKLVDGGMMNIVQTKWLGAPLNLSDITVVKSSDDGKKKDSKKKEKEEKEDDSAAAEGDQSSEGEGDQPAEGEGDQPAEGEGEQA